MSNNSLEDNENKRKEQQTYTFSRKQLEEHTAYVKTNVLNQCFSVYIYYIYIYINMYIYKYIYIYTIKLFPSLIKCSILYTIERFN